MDEAALIKMPTGTGKTAVIATLACCSPLSKKTLVITPRAALVRQMTFDLSFRFWQKLHELYCGYSKDRGMNCMRHPLLNSGTSSSTRSAKEDKPRFESSNLKTTSRSTQSATVIAKSSCRHSTLCIWCSASRRLLIDRCMDESPEGWPRVFTACRNIWKVRYHSRFQRKAWKSFEHSLDSSILSSWAKATMNLPFPRRRLSELSEHRRSSSPRHPTESDYKYFDIDGGYVFNLPWDEAVEQPLIRDVEIDEPAKAAKNGRPAPMRRVASLPCQRVRRRV